MAIYKMVKVHDRYDSMRATRIKCEYVRGSYYCNKRQVRDAVRRARVMPGSYLRSSSFAIYVTDDDGRCVDIIGGCRHA